MTAKTGFPLIDNIIRSKRKTIALVIKPDGSLLVRAPLRATQREIDRAVREKAEWIHKTQQSQQEKYAKVGVRHYAEGENFWYLGREYALKLAPNGRTPLRLEGDFLLSEKAQSRAADAFKQWYRKQAFAYLSDRVALWAQKYHFQYKTIKITSARTRWGSCSSRGTISFPWRLIMLPPTIIDYIIVHELAHTVHPNHSQKFWKLVESIMPDYKDRRKWLKTNSHWFQA